MKGRAFVLALVLSLTGSAVAAAPATTVYRCGPDGRSYSQEPCPGGRAIDVDDPRTPDQRSDGAAAVRRDAALARRLERDRRLAESRVPRAVSLSAPRPVAVKPVRSESPKGRSRTKPRVTRETGPVPVAPSKVVPGGAAIR